MIRLLAAVVAIWLAALPVRADTAPPHFEIDATLDPAARSIAAHVTVTVAGRDAFVYRLADWMTVQRLTVDGELVDGHGPDGVPLPSRGQHTVAIDLEGIAPAMPDNPRRGQRGAAFDPRGGYLPAGSGWMPVTDDYFVTYHLTVRIPAPQVAISTGRIAVERTDAGLNVLVVEATEPSEPPSLFTGPYRIAERMHGDMRLRTYFYDDIARFSDLYLDRTAEYLDMLIGQIGDYPYDDFHVVAGPLPVGLGFPGLTYIGRMIVPLPFMQGRSLAHEIAHSWWGNAVGVDYRTGNWAEGITTYMADYALAKAEGPAAARDMRLGWLRDFAALPPEKDSRIVDFVTKSHDPSQIVGYNKVAFMFHMLRGEIGDAAFDDGIRAFWRDRRFTVAGWDDLRAAFSDAAGRNLDGFFDQWLRRIGAPRIEIVSATRTEAGVRLTLRQSGPAYAVKVPVVLRTEVGETRTTVDLKQAEQTFDIPSAGSVTHLAVDPAFDLFRRLLPGESAPILRDVTLATDPVAVVLGGDPAVAETAAGLLRAMFRGRPVATVPLPDNPPSQPFVVVGLDADIERALDDWRLGPAPTTVGDGTAAAWTVRTADGVAGVVIRAEDKAALARTVRSLPHYGRRGYVVFGPDGVTGRGEWPVTDSPMARVFN